MICSLDSSLSWSAAEAGAARREGMKMLMVKVPKLRNMRLVVAATHDTPVGGGWGA